MSTSLPSYQSSNDALWKALFQDALDILIVLESETGIIRAANPAVQRVLGYDPDDLEGQHFSVLFPETSMITDDVALYRLRVHGGVVEVQEFRAADGSTQLLDLSVTMIDIESGPVTLVTLRDAAERRDAEVELEDRASELEHEVVVRTADTQLFRLLVEHAPNGICIANLNGTVIYANPELQQMLGYGEDTIGMNIHDVCGATANEQITRAQQITEPMTWYSEVALQRKDGSTLDAHISSLLIPGSAHREPMVAAIVRDISERKQHEIALQRANDKLELRVAARTAELSQVNAALRQSEEQLRNILQHMPVLLDAFDDDGKIAVWNTECERVTGYSAAEIVNNPDAMNLLYPDPAYRNLLWGQWQQNGQYYRESEWQVTAKDGTVKTIAWSNISKYFPISGWTTWAIGVDVTERKRAEAALKAERESLSRRVDERTADLNATNVELARAVRTKDEFLANMSHELRTPLNAILGLAEAVQEGVYGALTEKQQASLRTIEESGRHLLTLINDILDLSKIEAGKVDLELGLVDVEEVCRASLRMVKQAAQKKQITLSKTLDTSVLLMEADERRLKQILVNLLSNAVKFTPAGGQVTLEVAGDHERRVAYFRVHDTGIGISAEQMGRLFKPFTQIDAGLNRQHEGTGLGLSLVLRLAELHGGSVGVESESGNGSSFTIALPWNTGVSTAMHTAPDAADQENVAALPQNALVIEDSRTDAQQITRYLDELHISSVVTDLGEQTFAHVAETNPSVILLDILLPDVSGWEVLKQLKRDPQTRDIPVVIISNVDNRPRGFELGAAAYLVKPIGRSELHTALSAAIGSLQASSSPALLVMSRPEEHTRRPLVLLAEDNRESNTMVAEYLEARGYQVARAYSGVEAISIAASTPPDAILMDIQMPGMDGLEAMRQLRRQPAMQQVPIISLTALAMPGDRERCLEAGATEYLSKPVSLKHLNETLRFYLNANAGVESTN